jgi:hypothetical protein
MADFVKPLNRLKPFTRINNDSSIPTEKDVPNGDGVSCGCHTPDGFTGQFADKFKNFLDSNMEAIGTLKKFLQTLHDIAGRLSEYRQCCNGRGGARRRLGRSSPLGRYCAGRRNSYRSDHPGDNK